jgi:hypothetical protein
MTEKTTNCGEDAQVIKAFAALPIGLLQCLVCGEICTQETASEHAEVDCKPPVEFCLLEPTHGGHNVI